METEYKAIEIYEYFEGICKINPPKQIKKEMLQELVYMLENN